MTWHDDNAQIYFNISEQVKVMCSTECPASIKSKKLWKKCQVSSNVLFCFLLFVLILHELWVDFRWMVHSVFFQQSAFHALFHTIMLSQFDCPGRRGIQNHHFLKTKCISTDNKCVPNTAGGCSHEQLQKRIISKVVSALTANINSGKMPPMESKCCHIMR